MNKRIQQAEVLLQQKKVNPNKILKLLRPLIKKKNTPWKAYHFSGIAHFLSKEFTKAERFLKRAQESNGQNAEIKYFLGRCKQITGDHEEAIEYLKQAVKLNRDDYKAWMLLGDLQREAGDLNEVMQSYGQCNRIDPSKSEVAMKTGEIYRDQAFTDKALEMFDIVLKMEPNNITALNEKANLLKNKLELEHAEEVIQQALGVAPDNAGLLLTKAEILREGGDFLKALDIYKEILVQKPKLAAARTNYANILQDLGRLNEAEENFLQASKDDPSIQESFSNYLFVQHYNPEKTKEEIINAHKKWDSIFAPDNPIRPVPENQDKDKVLRVGLVSGGFRRHPVGWMIVAGMEHLPKDNIKLVYYSNHSKVDEITKRLYKTAAEWRMISGFSDQKLNEQIREDAIDILVELSGHAAESRLRAVAMEPAPVIVKWVGGLINTTGLKAIDYLITDWIETPAGSEPDYLEKLVRMPDDYICFTPSPDSPDVKESPFRENGYITFGCFNNPIKVNPVLLEKWAAVMKQVPESRLFLKSKQYGNESFTRRIVEQMEAIGIEKDRLIFEGQSPHAELMEAYNRVDIALDPWPYSGGLTTCEALWMGVPVITYPGPTFAGRHAATHVNSAGSPEWIAGSWEEYTQKIVELAADIEALSELRSNLREIVADSALCNGEHFGVALAQAFREMWRQRVDGYEDETGTDDWRSPIDLRSLTDKDMATINHGKNGSADENLPTAKDELVNEILFKNGTQTDMGQDELLTSNDASSEDDTRHVPENDGSATAPSPLRVADDTNTESNYLNENLTCRKGTHQNLLIKTKDGTEISVPESLEVLTAYALMEKGQWIEPELSFVKDYLKPGMTVVDVGAGFGVYSLPLAKTVGENGFVYAFEPASEAKKHLEISKIENDIRNLDISGRAVAESVSKQKWKSGKTPEYSKLDKDGKEHVQTASLRSWWQFEGEPPVDLIKIDVNGDEKKVLAGAKKLLEKETPLLLISITEKNAEPFSEILTEMGYSLYEYIPGPGILAEHDAEAGADPYMQNLIAIHESQLEEVKRAGWLYDETVTPQEVKNDLWKTELAKLPWTSEMMEEWRNHDDSEGINQYLQALNYLVAAEQVDIRDSDLEQPRSQKAALLLTAAQMLIGLYNQGGNSTSVAFTLVRTLTALGKRAQAVEVMQKLIETTKLGKENMNVDLPFMLPIPEQDSPPIKTDLDKWLMVKTVEAWILLKDVSTYFSGPREKKLIEVLEGNSEVCRLMKRLSIVHQYYINGEKDFNKINAFLATAFNESVTLRKIAFSPLRSEYFKTMVKMIRSNGAVNASPHNLPGELIVSLTSYPDRFEHLPLTLLSLIKQSVEPNKIILWIAENDKDALTEEILQFQEHGVEILFCDDLKSYKKIIPTLEMHPEAYIITADDDLYYSREWVQGLVQDYESNDCVVAHRAHRILFDENGHVKPYKEWGWQYREDLEPSELNFPTSGAGTLYPPGIFHEETTNRELFQTLSPKADDVWLYFMVKLNGGMFKVSRYQHKLMEWKQKNNNTLWKENLIKGENDKQIKKVSKYFGISLTKKTKSYSLKTENVSEVQAGNKKYEMVLPNWQEDHIQKIIATSHRPYELGMLSDMQNRISADDLFIDVGANIGNHTIFMAKVVGCKVLSFEPNKYLVDALSETIKMNNLSDFITLISKGVGKINSYASFAEEVKNNIGSQKLSISTNKNDDIEVITLDSLKYEDDIKMIKIDVEGMELDVLEGARKIISKDHPIIYAEAATKEEFLPIYKYLSKLNYNYVKSFNATPTHLFMPVKL